MKKHRANYADGLIYIVRNNINDFVYIGSTVNLFRRAAVHKCQAKLSEAPLYRDMRSFGFHNFRFEILKGFPCENRKALEDEEYSCLALTVAAGIPVYNLRQTARDKKSDATKRAMSAAKLGKATKSGCLRKEKQGYSFQWRENGKLQNKWFGWKDRTPIQAKHAAWAFRQQKYPAWQFPAEEEACDALLLMQF